jgi:Arm DNA-binding domain
MVRQTDVELPVNPGRHRVDDNLWLQVRDAAHRSWLFRYGREGRAHDMGLGNLDRVPLEAARAEAARWRAVLREGRDPIAEGNGSRRTPRDSARLRRRSARSPSFSSRKKRKPIGIARGSPRSGGTP